MPATLIAPSSLPLHESANVAADLVVIDCRFQLGDRDAGRRAYERGHVPGAVYADLERDLSGPVLPGVTGRHPLPEPESLTAKLRSWGVAGKSRVVVYDEDSGAMAARLWWLLRWLGHDRVFVCDGGYAAWLSMGGQPSVGVPKPGVGDFEARLRPELTVDSAEVQELLAQGEVRLLDARAKQRFRGEVEPIDAVAGHIPGAYCLPFSENLEAGKFLDPARLASRYRAAIGDHPPERVVVYCGSGVTACHDILAAEHAGLGMFRLYAGSFSEWITDPKRAVATGD